MALIAAIYFLFLAPSSNTTDFRKTTEAGLSRKHGVLRGELSDEDLQAQTQQELQAILAKQDPVAGAPATVASSIVEDMEDVSVAGRKTMQKPKEKPKYPVAEADPAKGGEEVAYNGAKMESAVDKGKEMARAELQKILKMSPSKLTPFLIWVFVASFLRVVRFLSRIVSLAGFVARTPSYTFTYCIIGLSFGKKVEPYDTCGLGECVLYEGAAHKDQDWTEICPPTAQSNHMDHLSRCRPVFACGE